MWFEGINNATTNHGCGIITSANIFAYHKLNCNRYNLFHYPNTKDGFMDFIKFQQLIQTTTMAVGEVGSSSSTIENNIKNHSRANGYSYGTTKYTAYHVDSSEFRQIKNAKINSIDSNNPIALSFTYQYKSSDFMPDFANHCVTVTGYLVSGDDIDITMSSWGDGYNASLKELLYSKYSMTYIAAYKN